MAEPAIEMTSLKLPKAERYQWTKPGDLGRLARVPVGELHIDHSYQRSALGEGKVLAVAADFKWEYFGSLVVMKRATGKMFVVDGQHRLASVLRRGDIKAVPCIVFDSDGPAHEAKAFIALNCHRKPVQAIAKFRAGLAAKEQPHVDIARFLALHGLSINNDSNDPSGVSFPARLLETWQENPEETRQAIEIARLISPNERLHEMIHKGIYALLRAGINIKEFVPKIAASGGKTELLRSIHACAIEMQTSSVSARVCVVGVLRVINHKRRTKIKLKEAQ